MRAQDINFREMLTFHPEEGKVLLNGHRMLIFPQTSMSALSEVLADHLGTDFASAVFAQFGYRCGCEDFQIIGLGIDWETENDKIASGPVTHTWEGLVQVELKVFDVSKEEDRYYVEGNWHNSYEAINHLKSFGKSSHPVCASLAGYASGWCTSYFGRPVLAVETKCMAMGHSHCEILIKPEDEFGPEADPWRKALSSDQESIARILEEKVESHNRDLGNLKTALDKHSMIMVTDRNHQITLVNDLFCAISKYEREELIGKFRNVLNSNEHSHRFFSQIWTAIQVGNVWQGDLCLQAKDRSLFWVNTTIMPLTSTDGEPDQYIQICTDITAEKELTKKFHEAKIIADDANQAKSDFLATMSHEIRTPMNGVLGFTNLLLDSNLDDEQRHFLNTIRSSGETLLALLNDILDFSKIEAGELTLERTRFNLEDSLLETVELMSSKAKEKNIALKKICAEYVPEYIVCDHNRIRQVLLNLIGNAIKFTAKGQVVVQAENLDRENIKISVIDSGIGIEPDKISKLFQKFSQAESSTARRFGGSGLGLAISKRLVEVMGGEIGVNSVPGEGTTFWFSLPKKMTNSESELDDDIVDIERDKAVTGASIEKHALRVLLAEDNPTNQLLGKTLLKRHGCTADVAENGLIALNYWKENHYDLVLMDCHMPEMDGFTTTAEIRKLEKEALENGTYYRTKPLPIVACTASIMASERDACLNSGMDEFLPKPIVREELQNLLTKIENNLPEALKVITPKNTDGTLHTSRD